MNSPYVRRLRLGMEIRRLRKAAGLSSADALAQRIGSTRLQVTRLENGDRDRKIDLDEIANILRAVGIEQESQQWRDLLKVARDACEIGWWRSPIYRGMGKGQILAAELESGVSSLRMYEPTIVPGLLQTEAYTQSVTRAALGDGARLNASAAVAGRLRRQEQFQTSGATLEVIVEEIAVRRGVAPADVLADQLRHLVRVAASPQITIRVLPNEAEFVEVRSPREAYTLMDYADPDDPTIALVETVTDDVVLTEPDRVAQYVTLFDRSRDAALTADASLELIGNIADTVAAKI